MNYSENYNFALPTGDDGYDIAPISENFEAMDGLLAENETAMEEINEKIGTPAENGQTLFSLLGSNSNNIGLTAIKSIQHITNYFDGLKSSVTLSIQTVTPENCIVIFERLWDGGNTGCSQVNYTLTATTLVLSMDNYFGRLGFWIIEFC